MDALEKGTLLQIIYNPHCQHSCFKTWLFIIHIKYNVTSISDVRCISEIIFNKSLVEILQINKGRASCLVQKQTLLCRYLLKFDVVLTSKFPRRAPGHGGSLF